MRIFRRDDEGTAFLEPIETTPKTVGIELDYLREVAKRGRLATPPTTLVIDPGPLQELAPIAPARYRLDWKRPAFECEQEAPRRDQLWGNASPTREQVRAIAMLAGLTGSHAAEILGVTSRTWRRWTGGDVPCPPSARFQLLVVSGLHPDYEKR